MTRSVLNWTNCIDFVWFLLCSAQLHRLSSSIASVLFCVLIGVACAVHSWKYSLPLFVHVQTTKQSHHLSLSHAIFLFPFPYPSSSHSVESLYRFLFEFIFGFFTRAHSLAFIKRNETNIGLSFSSAGNSSDCWLSLIFFGFVLIVNWIISKH